MATFYFASNDGSRNWKMRSASEPTAWRRLANADGESIAKTKRSYDIVYPDRNAARLFEDLAKHEKTVKILTKRRRRK